MSVEQINVEKLAHLARLELNTKEKSTLTDDLQSILQYVARVQEVKVKGKSQAAGVNYEQTTRADEVKTWGEGSELVKQAPENENNMVVVPGVFGE